MQLVWFILLVGILILVHELGHYTVARLFDVKVLRLSLGFGPALLRWRRRETEYTVSAFPIGGYVKLLGEDPADQIADEERGRAFPSKPLWQRVLVVLAGPAANLIFPAFLYFQYFAGEHTLRAPVIGTVFAGQPAAGADLKPGDRVVAIDDQTVRYWEEVESLVRDAPGRELRITVERPGETGPLTKTVTARAHERRDALGAIHRVGQIGVAAWYQLAQIGVVGVVDGDGKVRAERSPAAQAGLRTFDVVTSVNGRPVDTWADLERVLLQNRGEALLITYLRRQEASPGFLGVGRLVPGSAHVFPARLLPGQGARYDSGIRPGERFVAEVEPGTPADTIGLRPGDMLTTLDDQPILHWDLFQQQLEERRERPFKLGWRTAAGEDRAREGVRLEPRTERDEYQTESTLYVFGAQPNRAVRWVPEVPIEGRIVWAARRAIALTGSVTRTMVRVLGHLVAGRLPVSAVGGPLMIYHLAGVTGARGSGDFLQAMALVSLNLGLLNLLPVPLLDGGHLLFFGVEAVRKRPVSRRTRERATWIGMAVIGALMLLALRNDILRFWPR